MVGRPREAFDELAPEIAIGPGNQNTFCGSFHPPSIAAVLRTGMLKKTSVLRAMECLYEQVLDVSMTADLFPVSVRGEFPTSDVVLEIAGEDAIDASA